jgi:serine/threonine-protein kinase
LVADDEGALRRAFARKLRLEGYEILEAATGAVALEILAAEDVDLVLSDITMPDMDGVELLRLSRDRKPDVPVVLMTGAPQIATAIKAVEYGAFEYLTKPFDLVKLMDSVTRAIKQRRKLLADRHIIDSAVRSKNASGPRSAGARTIAPGTLLDGRYRVVRALGAGGMGTVYEAEREDLANLRVAIKVLHPRLIDRADIVQRFRREAELVAKIRSPNIVSIIDFVAVEDGPTFLVMELLQGATLEQTIQRDPPLSERRTAFIASQILEALEAAHAADIVHRDLKPENVFLTTMSQIPDVVKLLDFGIAKVLSEDPQNKLTQTGTVLGTPAYMAPEYARGEPASAVGDLYALGCVLYEALTKKAPYEAANYNALLFAIQGKAPTPLHAHRADVSPEMTAIVARAMAKDPRDRFASARAMRDALEPWLDGEPTSRAWSSQPPPLGSAPTEELPAKR